jgi:hypothetical protein
MAKAPRVNIGDRVRFTSAWLRSTCSATSPVARLRGTVVGIKSYSSGGSYATIEWDTLYFETRQTNVLDVNLQKLRA